MFGFNKKKPLIEGPVEFEAEVAIDAPASKVYRLLDVADPGFGQIELGNTVKRVPATQNEFHLSLVGLEDLTFCIRVLNAEPHSRITNECVIEPRFGNLVKAIEDHVIEATGENSCKVVQRTTATFVDGISDPEIAAEIALMSAAVENDLFKLKVHAEEGAEAVAALDDDGFAEIEIEDWC